MNKNIHQIWLQGAGNIPKKYHKYSEKTIEMNPDWTYKVWDDEDLKRECLKYSKECFNKYMTYPHLHQKVDLGRYVVLYNNGGISVDMDARTVKSLNEIPGIEDNKMIVCQLDMNKLESMIVAQRMHIVNNAHIYSPKHNPSLKKVIDGVLEQTPTTWGKEIDISLSTGPWRLTKLIDDDVIVLSHKYFEPRCLGDKNPYPETIILHDYDLTWVSGPTKYLRTWYIWIKKNFWFIVIVAVILFIAIRYVNINTNMN
jgi:mannosyltransferase OCH1-like enzyme